MIEAKHAFLEVFPNDVVGVIKHRYSHKRVKAYVRPWRRRPRRGDVTSDFHCVDQKPSFAGGDYICTVKRCSSCRLACSVAWRRSTLMMNRRERGVRPDGMKETRRHGFPNGIRNQFLPKAEQEHNTLTPSSFHWILYKRFEKTYITIAFL